LAAAQIFCSDLKARWAKRYRKLAEAAGKREVEPLTRLKERYIPSPGRALTSHDEVIYGSSGFAPRR